MKDEVKPINLTVAEHLKKLRNFERLSMRELGAIIGTSHSFVGKIEKQGRRIDVGEFIFYCRALEKDPEEVLRDIMKLL
jgi:transcriptional regulator with XRE-family HTH domain